jgi:hypothetical protein
MVDFSVLKYLEVSKQYKYDDSPLLKCKEKYYVHKELYQYEKKELIKAVVFKPEGPLYYNKEDLGQDSLLVKMLEIEFIKFVIFNMKELFDNKKIGTKQ